jgi:hypothetical protein
MPTNDSIDEIKNTMPRLEVMCNKYRIQIAVGKVSFADLVFAKRISKIVEVY